MIEYEVELELREEVTRTTRVTVTAANLATAEDAAKALYENGGIRDWQWNELDRSIADIAVTDVKKKGA